MATIVSYTARPRRLTQALLLAFAVVIGVGAYALVGLGRFDEVPADLMQVGVGSAVLAAALQVVVMWRTPYADPVILPLVVLLNLLGIAMIKSVHAANEIYG
ncbi:MAG: FtsW/RodA/SpoVE family cell cycle protein, partial [Brachybacterium tyrofermentans]